jgi:putative N6-adenine-specific DNA methylase
VPIIYIYMNLDHKLIPLTAKTQFGLEGVLAAELKKLGAKDIQEHNRLVSFKGDKALMYKANLHLRTALKILMPIARFKSTSERALYEEVRRIKWSDYLDVDGTLAVHAVIKSDFFNHSQYVALKTKDAIVDEYRDRFGRRPSVDTQNPDLSVDVHIFKDDVTISIDSSGQSLHRRGYRGENTLAPINEVTAAGMILLSDWDGTGNFIDPMCGSGTLLIEAGLIARNIAPNRLRKRFGFHNWKDFDVKIWNTIKDESENQIIDGEANIMGSDKTFKAIEIARGNVERAGLDEDIRISNKRMEDWTPPQGGGIVMINPPYGERIDVEEITSLYKLIGDLLKQRYIGYNAWIISSDKEALKRVGLTASKKIMLYNGALECKFHKFELYKGSKQSQ